MAEMTPVKWLISIKCHSDDFLGNKKGETGKPHKLETQILVGESYFWNSTKIRLSMIEINDYRFFKKSTEQGL